MKKAKKAVQFIDDQCLNCAKTNKTRPVHNLRAMYEKPLEIAQEVFHEDVNERGDFTFKPRPLNHIRHEWS